MVDHKSGTYRPRRALIEPDVEPAKPERPTQAGDNGSGHNGSGQNGSGQNGSGHNNGRGDDHGKGNRNGRGLPEPVERLSSTGPARSPRTESVEGRPSVGSAGVPVRPEPVEGRPRTSPTRPPLRPRVDEDQPKPLYREDAPFHGSARPASRAAPMPADPPTEETAMTPATLAPRRTPSRDDETTTILPRSRPTKSLTQALDAIDDYDEDERRPLGQGAKLALVIGAMALVVVIGLLIGYAVRGAANQPQPQASVSPPTGGGTLKGGNQPPGQNSNAVLSDASMLNPNQAKILDADRSWKVVTTQQGATADSLTAACFGGEPAQGQPTPQQELIRVLKGGKTVPSVLHTASAYPSIEDASVAYTIASKTLGGCAVTGSYIASGRRVDGIGDQAVGLVVMEVQGKKKIQAHSVILNRTGRVVNVLDATQASKAIAIDAVAKAMGKVNGAMCAATGGKCGSDPSVSKGPPPLGGDEPGFLASGDLPPAGPKVYPWVATPVGALTEPLEDSGCEGVNWKTEPAKSRSSRTYMIQESGKDFFGVDEVLLTTKSHQAAVKLVSRVKSSLSKCRRVQLTPTVSTKKVTSIGDQKTKISGWTAVVTQKSTQGRVKYRVGIVSAGAKVVYTFANPRGEYDFTDQQWNTVAVRAGERATQVS